ncbi:MAG: hypothetical protein EPO08_04460 [Rhodospirillaceae bacterium]|nr:MAG: hypothetical protein EPO08_04460 [Rhodospirillaceae bacterium]
MTALADVVTLINNCKTDIQTLQAQGQAALQAVAGNLQGRANRATAFSNALGQPFNAAGADRVPAIQAEIDSTQATLNNETDPVKRMVLMRHVANLQQYAAAAGLNAALANVAVVFSPAEVTEIQGLLTQAQRDIQARQTVASAIQILTSVITACAHIAGKVATSGLV